MMLTGQNAVAQALRLGRVLELFLSKARPELEQEARNRGVPVQHLDVRALREMHAGVRQQVLARCRPFELEPLERLAAESRHILLLDRIQDVGNLGAIVRNCAAFGVDIVLTQHRSAPLNQDVARISAGGIELVRIARVGNLVRAMEVLKAQGFWIFGLEMDGEALRGQNLRGRTALVLGNEDRGIAPLVQRHCDALVRIPMPGGMESLNAASASAIALYELSRSDHDPSA